MYVYLSTCTYILNTCTYILSTCYTKVYLYYYINTIYPNPNTNPIPNPNPNIESVDQDKWFEDELSEAGYCADTVVILSYHRFRNMTDVGIRDTILYYTLLYYLLYYTILYYTILYMRLDVTSNMILVCLCDLLTLTLTLTLILTLT